jgi:hypothetical protein
VMRAVICTRKTPLQTKVFFESLIILREPRYKFLDENSERFFAIDRVKSQMVIFAWENLPQSPCRRLPRRLFFLHARRTQRLFVAVEIVNRADPLN